MPASWKISLATVLFCTQIVPVSMAAESDTSYCNGFAVADVSELLNRDSEWIHVTGPAFLQHEVAPETSSADESTNTEDDELAVTVKELFPSLQNVHASGPSSVPPELPDEADIQSLEQPGDLAGSYTEPSFAAYYAASGYGIRRPPRNSHRFYSHPLYYEDANLERCGRSKGCLTTACSTLHFVSRAAFTPYQMALDHPNRCVASLPDCPTCHKFNCDATCPRWSLKAAIVQGAAVTGIVYAIP